MSSASSETTLQNVTSKNHDHVKLLVLSWITPGLETRMIILFQLRDFLLQYNKMSESCFLNCVNHLSDRSLSQDECGCVDMCTKKHVSVNHKVMQVYMEIQPLLIKKRIEEMNKQTAVEEVQKKEDAPKTVISDVEKSKVEGVS